MPRWVIKPEASDDWYVVWSSIVDNVVIAGTRAQVEAALMADLARDAERQVERMLGEADSPRKSTSLIDDDLLFVANVDREPEHDQYSCWWLPRVALGPYSKALAEGDRTGAEALLIEEDRE